MADQPRTLFTRDLSPGPIHQGEEIWLPQLVAQAIKGGKSFIRRRLFIDCRIEGPAVFMAMGGCVFDNCDMGYNGGDVRNLLLRPVGTAKVIGAIGFEDCEFRGCRFFSVGFTGPTSFIDNFIAVLGQTSASPTPTPGATPAD